MSLASNSLEIEVVIHVKPLLFRENGKEEGSERTITPCTGEGEHRLTGKGNM